MTKKRHKQQYGIKSSIKPLIPKTSNQSIFMDAIEDYDLVICDAISGTGKTTIAAGMAVKYMEEGKIDKIIVVRPPVQCGKSIGYLPGTDKQKTAPYMQPVLEALEMFVGETRLREWIGEGRVEQAVIGFMRGTNLHNSFLIVDEMQNATSGELKMVGTRIGKFSKAVFIGDMAQSDLGEQNTRSLWSNFFGPLKSKEAENHVKFVTLTEIDIIRSKISKIIATKCK